jgi:DNA-binding XRE family transcriptional regulator
VALSTTPSVVKRYIGFELQRLREEARKGQPEAAKKIDTSKARIGHLENGRSMPRLPEVEMLLTYYGAPELIEDLQHLIVQTRDAETTGAWRFDLDPGLDLKPGFSMYVGLEQGASRIFTYDAVLVMGLLQCRAYAEAVVRGSRLGGPVDDGHVDALVDLRMRRQVILDRVQTRPEVVAVIDEGVLRKQIGGPAVAAEQLAYLLTVAERHNVIIRVLPESVGAHPALHGPYTQLSFPIERDPGVVYNEDVTGGRLTDDTEHIDRYTQVGARLLELALPEGRSLSVIDNIRKEYAP